MSRAYAPREESCGTTNVGPGWTDLMPGWQDMLSKAKRWLMWVSNDGPDPVNVQFCCSPDGANPDIELSTQVVVPPNHAAGSYGDGLHRYWTISAQSTTSNTCTVRHGITLELDVL